MGFKPATASLGLGIPNLVIRVSRVRLMILVISMLLSRPGTWDKGM